MVKALLETSKTCFFVLLKSVAQVLTLQFEIVLLVLFIILNIKLLDIFLDGVHVLVVARALLGAHVGINKLLGYVIVPRCQHKYFSDPFGSFSFEVLRKITTILLNIRSGNIRDEF